MSNVKDGAEGVIADRFTFVATSWSRSDSLVRESEAKCAECWKAPGLTPRKMPLPP
jgi:hypothetical protein